MTIINSYIDLNTLFQGKYEFYSLSILNVTQNNIENGCVRFPTERSTLKTVLTVDLSYNTMKIGNFTCFNTFINLRMLHLQFNMIHTVNNLNLIYLKYLDLSNNLILKLQKGFFKELIPLEVINIGQNPFFHVDSQVFKSVTSLLLKTDNQKIRCIAEMHKFIVLIHTNRLISNCKNLLSQEKIGNILFPLLILSFFLNISSFILKQNMGDKRKSYDILVLFINISDMLIMVYLSG